MSPRIGRWMSHTFVINVLIAVVFRANIAQCNAVLPWDWSTRFGLAPNVSNNRTGSNAHTFHAAHINAVMPPRSCRSGLPPRAMKYATNAVCPNWAAKCMQEQPSASRKLGSAPAPMSKTTAPKWPWRVALWIHRMTQSLTHIRIERMNADHLPMQWCRIQFATNRINNCSTFQEQFDNVFAIVYCGPMQ